ncbi:MAG TPA: hypothetical protein VK119_00910 [Bacillota bacterium]|nr:hypothetical protein [Bacillota bacterium]
MKHQRLYGKQQISMKWTTYFHLLAKRPMAIKYSSVYQELPTVWQTYLEKCTIPEKQATFKFLADILSKSNFEELTQILTNAISVKEHPSIEDLHQSFYARHLDDRTVLNQTQIESLPALPEATRGIQRYDRLLIQVGDNDV